MIIVMKPKAKKTEVEHVINRVKEIGLKPHPIYGTERTVVAAIGDKRNFPSEVLEALPGVERVVPILAPYKIASHEVKQEKTQVKVDSFLFGGTKVGIIAGPCTVEDEDQIIEIAQKVRDAGAVALRGGAYKPRTSPYSFQGLEERGLEYLAKARQKTGIAIVTEVMSSAHVALVSQYADVLQIGARNMQNYMLLKACGLTNKPVLLKRGLSATFNELLFAAEYILSQGNASVMLCERGIRTFEDHTRFTLSLSIVPELNEKTHLPVLVDPSHGTGKRSLVGAMSKGAVAVGADGLLIEVAIDPENALVDANQTISCDEFAALVRELKTVAQAVGRDI